MKEPRQKKASACSTEELLTAFFRSFPTGLFLTDDRGKFLMTNDTFCELSGYGRSELIGKHAGAVFHPDSREKQLQEQEACLSGHAPGESEKMILKKDGTSLAFLTRSELLMLDGGQRCLKTIVREMREAAGMSAANRNYESRLEEAVRTSNERFVLLAKATNDAIWDWDFLTGKVVRTGTGFEKLFGYNAEMASREDDFWTKRVHPEDRARVSGGRKNLVEVSREVYWEDRYRFLKADGRYAWVYDKAYIIRDEKGKAIRLIGAMQDFTKDKEQLNEIVRIQGNLYSLINTTTDMIWSVDKDLKIIAANQAFSELIRTVSGRAISEGDDVLVPAFGEEIINEWKDIYKKTLGGEPFSGEQSFFRLDKQETWYNIVTISPIVGSSGEVSGVACYAKDVTELKKTAEQLRELNIALNQRAKELAASNAELEHFAYIASHDLQEPLRAITGFLQLLEKQYAGLIDETGNKYIQFAVDGAERMKRLILDLLEYSRAGTKKDDTGLTDMNEVVQETIKNLNKTIEETQASLIVEQLPELPARKSQMLQLMQNLISNALKYCDAKKPEIRIGVKEEEKEWVFFVEDNGIGIEPHHRERIFVIFQRLHSRNEYSGTGIGLSICKKIVEGHGGNIWVDSNPGKGSIFYFSLSKKKEHH